MKLPLFLYSLFICLATFSRGQWWFKPSTTVWGRSISTIDPLSSNLLLFLPRNKISHALFSGTKLPDVAWREYTWGVFWSSWLSLACCLRQGHCHQLIPTFSTQLCDAFLFRICSRPWRGSWCCLWSMTSVRGRKRAATFSCCGESESSLTMRECCSCGGKNAGNAFWMRAQCLIGVYVVFFNVPASATL